MPKSLRKDLKTVWIHDGDHPAGGGNNNLMLHTEATNKSLPEGKLEEALVHEASHTSLDACHATNTRWQLAQKLDKEFISRYASDNPEREDIAESFLLYLAYRWKPERLDAQQREKIASTIPNRIRYFDSLDLQIQPLSKETNWRAFPWTSIDGKTIYD